MGQSLRTYCFSNRLLENILKETCDFSIMFPLCVWMGAGCLLLKFILHNTRIHYVKLQATSVTQKKKMERKVGFSSKISGGEWYNNPSVTTTRRINSAAGKSTEARSSLCPFNFFNSYVPNESLKSNFLMKVWLMIFSWKFFDS